MRVRPPRTNARNADEAARAFGCSGRRRTMRRVELRSPETLSQFVLAGSWGAGPFARTKRLVAVRLLALWPESGNVEDIKDADIPTIGFLEGLLDQLDTDEANGDQESPDMSDAAIEAEIDKGIAAGRRMYEATLPE